MPPMAKTEDVAEEGLMAAEASMTAWSNHLVLASMKLTQPGTRPSSIAFVWRLLHGRLRRLQLLDYMCGAEYLRATLNE